MEHIIIKINASKMHYMVLNTVYTYSLHMITVYTWLQFIHDYVLYVDKLYVSLHVMRLRPIMDNPENNQHFNVLI